MEKLNGDLELEILKKLRDANERWISYTTDDDHEMEMPIDLTDEGFAERGRLGWSLTFDGRQLLDTRLM